MRYLMVIVFMMFVFFSNAYGLILSSCSSYDVSGYFELSNNISFSGSGCFSFINADVVMVDCKGYWVKGDYSGYGFKFENISELYLMNCFVDNASVGFNLTNVSFSEISDVRVYNSSYAFYGYLSQGAIYDVYMNNITYGFYLKNSSFNSSNGFGVNGSVFAEVYNASLNLTAYEVYGYNLSFYVGDGLLYVNDSFINASYIFDTYSSIISAKNNVFISETPIISTASSYDLSDPVYCSRLNIVGGPCKGGNFWGIFARNAYSDICNDADGNGICDGYSFDYSGATDSAPLSRYVVFNQTLSSSVSDPRYEEKFYVSGKLVLMPYKDVLSAITVYVYGDDNYGSSAISQPDGSFVVVYSKPAGSKVHDLKVNVSYDGLNSYALMHIKQMIYESQIYLPGFVYDYDDNGYGLLYDDGNFVVVLTPMSIANALDFSSYGTGTIATFQSLKTSLVVGLSNKPFEETSNRADKFRDSNEYCMFSFSDIIRDMCKLTLYYAHNTNIDSNLDVVGPGKHTFKVKRTSDSVFIDVQ